MVDFEHERQRIIGKIASLVYRDKFGGDRKRYGTSAEQRRSESEALAIKHFDDMGKMAEALVFVDCCFDGAEPDRDLCCRIINVLGDCGRARTKTAAKYFEEIAEDFTGKCWAILAMHLTPLIEPDVPIPADGYSYGYTINSFSDTLRVFRAASYSSGHWTASDLTTPYPKPEDKYKTYQSWSQNGIRLYSTVELAMKACRAAISWRYAKALAEMDRQIRELQPETKWTKKARTNAESPDAT